MKICPKCAAENADTAKFCNECGTALEIKKTETPETVNDPEPVSETSKENISTVENVESTPVALAETVRDGLESTTEQIEKKEEPSPKKKNHLIIGIVAVALVCIIGFMATRPRLKSLEITYTGDTANGVVLDNDNEGFTVIAVYSDGRKENVPQGEWQIAESKTLETDRSTNVTIGYKNINQEINIDCTSTKLQYITATYNGSTYDGTVIDRNSDITVIGHFKNENYTSEFDGWFLDPETVTLKEGITSKVTVAILGDDGVTYPTVLEITGTEKPFAGPEVEGDHFNCSINQFVKYVNEKTVLTLFPIDKVFGEEYDCYGIKPPNEVTEISNEDVLVLAMRENQDGKLQNCVVYSLDETSGMAAALQVAKILDDTVDTSDKSKLASFVTKKSFATNKIAIWMWQQKDSSYYFHIMTADGTKKLYNDTMDKYGDILNNN